MTTPDTDVRPPLTAEEQIAETNRRVEDLAATVLARLSRRPTGDIEATLRTTPKPDTLLLNGATVSRTVYAALWQWVQDNGLAGPGKPFGTGDGVSTFVLPDLRGRTLVGATTDRPVGTVYGATERVILPANMATHTHQVQVRDHMSTSGQTRAEVGSDITSHVHGFGTSGVGDHGFHRPFNAIGPGGPGAEWTTNVHQGGGAHGHNGTTGNANAAHEHYLYIPPHAVTEVAVGQNTPFNIESPAYTVNYLLWT